MNSETLMPCSMLRKIDAYHERCLSCVARNKIIDSSFLNKRTH